ncbi:MAG: hypothetical protein EBZ55_04980 [Actinobacteria bacterium]|nr:hypothetical protein [Actinomycetota bacterium]
MHWIKAEIHEYILKNWRLVKVATTKAQRKLFFNLRSMKGNASHLDQATTEAIATQLNVSEADVREMDMRLTGRDIALDPGPDASDEDNFAPIDYLADDSMEPTAVLEGRARDRLQSEGLQQALDQLDERSRHCGDFVGHESCDAFPLVREVGGEEVTDRGTTEIFVDARRCAIGDGDDADAGGAHE